MAGDPLSVWRSVRIMWERMNEQAPELMSPVAIVHFADGSNIDASHVQRDEPWLIFSGSAEDIKDIRVEAVREEYVTRVEMKYVAVEKPPAKQPTGFTVAESGDDLDQIVEPDGDAASE